VDKTWRVVFACQIIGHLHNGPQIIVSAKDQTTAAGLALARWAYHPKRDPNRVYTIVKITEHV
jgi:hypothetical protein